MLLLGCVIASLVVWHRSVGSISVATVHEPRTELYYWIKITFSQTLGTALGDWTSISGVLLFWAAFILTRSAQQSVISSTSRSITVDYAQLVNRAKQVR